MNRPGLAPKRENWSVTGCGIAWPWAPFTPNPRLGPGRHIGLRRPARPKPARGEPHGKRGPPLRSRNSRSGPNLLIAFQPGSHLAAGAAGFAGWQECKSGSNRSRHPDDHLDSVLQPSVSPRFPSPHQFHFRFGVQRSASAAPA